MAAKSTFVPGLLLELVVVTGVVGQQPGDQPPSRAATSLPLLGSAMPVQDASGPIAEPRGEVLELKRTLQAQQAQLQHQAGGLQPSAAYLPASEPVSQAPAPQALAGGQPAIPIQNWPCGSFTLADFTKQVPIRIGGQYRVIFDSSNFDWHPATISDDQDTATFVNQRFRTWLSANPNGNVQGYMQLEVGHIVWGENFDFPKTYVGPFSAADDRVGIELRRGYLTYQNEQLGLFRVGIQDWHDAFGESYTLGSSDAVDDYDSMEAVLANSVWDFNVGGLLYTNQFASLGGMNLNAGVFTLWEGDAHAADDTLLFAFDFDWMLAEDQGFGMSLYYLHDGELYSYPTVGQYDSSWDLWLGIRGKTVLRCVPLRGFVIYNTGERKELGAVPDFEHDGWAFKVAAGPIGLGPGKLSLQTLYSTGEDDPEARDSNEFRTIAQSARDNFGSQGYWSYLILTSPHGPSDVNDLGVGLQNRGLGLFTIQAKYEYPIFACLTGTTAAGWLQSDEDNPVSGSSDMGTELVQTFTLDLSGGLAVDFGGAVFFTQDFYRAAGGPEPDDLWELFTRVQLEF